MRQIGTLPDDKQAQTLADYLLTLQISTRIDEHPGGWDLWVCDEDQVDRARQELSGFLQKPQDPRYQQAIRTARSLRRQEEHAEQEYQRKQTSFRERMGEPVAEPMRRPWTYGLIGVAIVAAAVTNLAAGPLTVYLKIAIPGMSPLDLVWQGQVWRLVTPIFIHYDPMHLIFNLMILFLLGGPIEERRGPVRYLVLVLGLAVLSNLGQYYLGHPHFNPQGTLILGLSSNFGGLSGVNYGLLGYLWMKSWLEPRLGLEVDQGMLRFLLAWYFLCLFGVIQWLTGTAVANAAHTFGLLAGIVIGAVPALFRSSGSR